MLADYIGFFSRNSLGQFGFRWLHVLAGITWIGLLYYFNFVQVPAFAAFGDEGKARNIALDKVARKALWWFRWAAISTFLTGILITVISKDYFSDGFGKSGKGLAISTGMLLGTIMMLNVWGVIWRNQKIVIASERAKLAGGEGDPAQPAAAKKAARASRANTLFSISMLWFMLFTTHFSNAYADPNGGVLLGAWGIFIVIVGFIELSALGLLGGIDNGFNTNVFDKHRNTIIAGFVTWALLFFGGWEIIIGS